MAVISLIPSPPQPLVFWSLDKKLSQIQISLTSEFRTKAPEVLQREDDLNEIVQVMKITPMQKQTRAGQRTRFKAFVVVGDGDGHVGLGVKCAKEVATAIHGAIILAKLTVVPIRRGYWGNKIGQPHTVPCKVTGKCGSVTVRMVPAPRGSGIVAARVPKKVLQFAGTKTLGNFVKGLKQKLVEVF
ncbi:hypothetical protein FCM35_KLT15940 [Carex littledalei]|uniref:Small ribosomal subunit protein uS5 n=1 Tax=Carex littledalei TaxID=544730 RepID=A0A833W1K3_9POAL|nr:hypothetical protein FCM35_KLT15940 [Carex littledalei]